MDQSYWRATDRPAARAASLATNILKFKRLIDREELPPLLLRNTIPICMSQYERLFSTTRIPGEEMDELIHYDTKRSKHIVVVCKGVYYRVDVFDSKSQQISSRNLEQKIEWIIKDATEHELTLTPEEKSVAALTAIDRSEWAV
ncbi:unnamed protein product, partial [Medioppia subpectinata]